MGERRGAESGPFPLERKWFYFLLSNCSQWVIVFHQNKPKQHLAGIPGTNYHRWILELGQTSRWITPSLSCWYRCCYSSRKKSKKRIVLNACKGWSEGGHTHYNLNVDEKSGCRRGMGGKCSVLESVDSYRNRETVLKHIGCKSPDKSLLPPFTRLALFPTAACLACSPIFNTHL